MPDLSDNIRHAQQDRDRSEADLAFSHAPHRWRNKPASWRYCCR